MRERVRAPQRSPARFAAVAALAAAAVVAAIVIAQPSAGHRVVVITDNATGVIPGLRVRAAGRPVGTVKDTEVTSDHQARIELELDDSVWPLAPDTTMQLRIGGTIKFTDRYIALERGRSTGRTIPDGGEFPASNFAVPVEFDQLLNTFDSRTRDNLRSLYKNAGQAFEGVPRPMQATLQRAPSALAEARDVLADLGADRESLHTLVTSADSVVHAINRADPGVGRLVSGSATTFDAIARRNTALRDMLKDLPPTMTVARETLGRADDTLEATGALMRRLAPGVAQVRRLAPRLNSTVPLLVGTGRDATSTLATLRRSSPELNALVRQLRLLMPQLGGISEQASTQLRCIRPFAPEIAGMISTWGTGLWAYTDGPNHTVRSEMGTPPFPNSTLLNSEQLIESVPNLMYAFPVPPGQTSGEPWFLRECGYGPETLDPSQDPESDPKAAMYPPKFVDQYDESRGDTGVDSQP